MNTYLDRNTQNNDSEFETDSNSEHENEHEQHTIDYAVDTLTTDLLQFEKEIQNSLMTPPSDNKSSREFTLYINSRDRDINGENTTFNFQVITDEQHTPGITNISDIKKMV